MYTYLKELIEIADVPEGYKAEIVPCCRPGYGQESVMIIHEEGKREGYAYPSIPLELFAEYVKKMGGGIIGVMLVFAKMIAHIEEAAEFDVIGQMKEENVVFRLMNKEGVKHLLDKIPYMEFNEEMVIMYYFLMEDGKGQVLTLISHDTLSYLKWEEGENLYNLAMKNTPKRLPVKMMTMAEILIPGAQRYLNETLQSAETEEEKVIIRLQFEAMIKEQKKLADKGQSPIVLSNENTNYGAAVILYPGLLKSLAEKLGDFYLIPSSVHEWLLYPANLFEREEICEMIASVNTTEVAPEEILGYQPVYIEAETFLKTGEFSR